MTESFRCLNLDTQVQQQCTWSNVIGMKKVPLQKQMCQWKWHWLQTSSYYAMVNALVFDKSSRLDFDRANIKEVNVNFGIKNWIKFKCDVFLISSKQILQNFIGGRLAVKHLKVKDAYINSWKSFRIKQ